MISESGERMRSAESWKKKVLHHLRKMIPVYKESEARLHVVFFFNITFCLRSNLFLYHTDVQYIHSFSCVTCIVTCTKYKSTYSCVLTDTAHVIQSLERSVYSTKSNIFGPKFS